MSTEIAEKVGIRPESSELEKIDSVVRLTLSRVPSETQVGYSIYELADEIEDEILRKSEGKTGFFFSFIEGVLLEVVLTKIISSIITWALRQRASK